MNIAKFIEYLNKENGWSINPAYYAYINEWREWWEGYRKTFHKYEVRNADGSPRMRTLYSMRMPKKICEDWASLLLNEKTGIVVSDDATQAWLMGENQISGILGALNFWPRANGLVELAFRSGTGAFVLNFDGLKIRNGRVQPSPDARPYLEYLPAECIIPITFRHGEVIDAAFVSEITTGGNPCIYLQLHRLTETGYEITNAYFRGTGGAAEAATYTKVGLPDGMAEEIETGSMVPWFALLRPNVIKNKTGGSGLGMAVFAEAIDQCMAVDRAFNNLVKDIELGGKKVFYSRELVRDEFDVATGKNIHITPDDAMQQLFYQLGDGADADEKNPITEFNPSLRVAENVDAVQNALNYLSFKCGLGTHHYQFDGASITTATQYSGDRQDMRQNVAKHAINVERALQQIMCAILWAGKNVMGAAIDQDAEITISFDDGFFTDNETTRALMAQDVRDGIIPKWRYAQRWYDLDEDAAKELVSEAADSGESLFDGDA